MQAQDYLKNCQVLLASKQYAVIKTREMPGNQTYLASLHTPGEHTLIVEESFAEGPWIEAAEPGWKLLSFQVQLPFELVGFLAIVAQALAEESIPIFVLSSFSSDHILVKEEHLSRALARLEALGCLILT